MTPYDDDGINGIFKWSGAPSISVRSSFTGQNPQQLIPSGIILLLFVLRAHAHLFSLSKLRSRSYWVRDRKKRIRVNHFLIDQAIIKLCIPYDFVQTFNRRATSKWAEREKERTHLNAGLLAFRCGFNVFVHENYYIISIMIVVVVFI